MITGGLKYLTIHIKDNEINLAQTPFTWPLGHLCFWNLIIVFHKTYFVVLFPDSAPSCTNKSPRLLSETKFILSLYTLFDCLSLLILPCCQNNNRLGSRWEKSDLRQMRRSIEAAFLMLPVSKANDACLSLSILSPRVKWQHMELKPFFLQPPNNAYQPPLLWLLRLCTWECYTLLLVIKKCWGGGTQMPWHECGGQRAQKVKVALHLRSYLRHICICQSSWLGPFQAFSCLHPVGALWMPTCSTESSFRWIRRIWTQVLYTCTENVLLIALFPANCLNLFFGPYYVTWSMSIPCLWSTTHIKLNWRNSCVYFNHI